MGDHGKIIKIQIEIQKTLLLKLNVDMVEGEDKPLIHHLTVLQTLSPAPTSSS